MKEFEYLTEPELQALMTDCGLALECMFEKHGIGERPLFVLHLFNDPSRRKFGSGFWWASANCAAGRASGADR